MNFGRKQKKNAFSFDPFESRCPKYTVVADIAHRQKQTGNKASNCDITKRDNCGRARELFKV